MTTNRTDRFKRTSQRNTNAEYDTMEKKFFFCFLFSAGELTSPSLRRTFMKNSTHTASMLILCDIDCDLQGD